MSKLPLRKGNNDNDWLGFLVIDNILIVLVQLPVACHQSCTVTDIKQNSLFIIYEAKEDDTGAYIKIRPTSRLREFSSFQFSNNYPNILYTLLFKCASKQRTIQRRTEIVVNKNL